MFFGTPPLALLCSRARTWRNDDEPIKYSARAILEQEISTHERAARTHARTHEPTRTAGERTRYRCRRGLCGGAVLLVHDLVRVLRQHAAEELGVCRRLLEQIRQFLCGVAFNYKNERKRAQEQERERERE